jgi:SecD/SecF fusion protein
LFFFGGATLQDFAFALLVGVTSGAYSSIFIAAPIVTLWKQREPEYARRRDQTSSEGGVSTLLALRGAEAAAAAEPTPETPVDAIIDAFDVGGEDDAAKRERRRQRRRSRPHGRAR